MKSTKEENVPGSGHCAGYVSTTKLGGIVLTQDSDIVLERRPTYFPEPEGFLAPVDEVTTTTTHRKHQDPGAIFESVLVPSNVESCAQSCRCQCYHYTTIESSRWLSNILGTLFHCYTGTPFSVSRPCNAVECILPSSSSYQLTYRFPRWVLNRAFTLEISYGGLGALSGSCSISFPRAIPVYHKAWLHI